MPDPAGTNIENPTCWALLTGISHHIRILGYHPQHQKPRLTRFEKGFTLKYSTPRLLGRGGDTQLLLTSILKAPALSPHILDTIPTQLVSPPPPPPDLQKWFSKQFARAVSQNCVIFQLSKSNLLIGIQWYVATTWEFVLGASKCIILERGAWCN